MLDEQEIARRFILFIDKYIGFQVAEIGRKKEKFLDVDLSELYMSDNELGEAILNSPEESIVYCEAGARTLQDLEGLKEFKIRFYNLPKSSLLDLYKINDSYLNKLWVFEGYVTRITDKMLKATHIIFECKCCGAKVSIHQWSNDRKKPKKPCSTCKGEDYFEVKEETTTFRRVIIDEDKEYGINRPATRKEVFAEDELARTGTDALVLGSKVQVIGWIKKLEIPTKVGNRSSEYKTGIYANNIIKISTGWNTIKLTEKDIDQIDLISKDKNTLNDFALSLAPTFYGYEEVRESLILALVEGRRIKDKNGLLMERRSIHIGLIGDPSTGKSFLLRRVSKLSALNRSTSGVGNTGVGLVAAVVQDRYSGYVCDVGPVIQANPGGCCGVDELEKMDKKDLAQLNNVMAEEIAEINKANIHEKFQAQVSILATMNPIHRKFILEEPIHKQIGLPKDFLDRFDLIWPMKVIDQDKILDKSLTKHLDEEEQLKGKYSFEEMRKYIASCREIIPKVTKEMLEYFKVKWKNFTGSTIEDDTNSGKSNRLIENLFRFVYAHCKFWRRLQVEKQDIDYVFALFKKNFKMLNLLDEKGFVSYERVESLPTKEEIEDFNSVEGILRKLKDETNNNITFEKLFEACKIAGIKENQVDDTIEKLKRKGDLYEPISGKILKWV